jgi:hypothetical protein
MLRELELAGIPMVKNSGAVVGNDTTTLLGVLSPMSIHLSGMSHYSPSELLVWPPKVPIATQAARNRVFRKISYR